MIKRYAADSEIFVGSAPTFAVTFTNKAGVLANPTTVTFSLKNPATGAVTTPSASNVSTGYYEVAVQLNYSGVWNFKWVTDATYGIAVEGFVTVEKGNFS